MTFPSYHIKAIIGKNEDYFYVIVLYHYMFERIPVILTYYK